MRTASSFNCARLLASWRKQDGGSVYVGLSLVPIRNSSGQTVGSTIIAVDVSARRQAILLQERLDSIVESSDDVIISKDLNGIIRSWNKGAARTFGYTAEEAIGKPVSMLAVPERVEEISDIIERIRRYLARPRQICVTSSDDLHIGNARPRFSLNPSKKAAADQSASPRHRTLSVSSRR